MANFADWLDVVLRIVGCAERMAGTTRLELATSAVTVSGFQVLSTTWKSTDGSASHWKYIIGNVIVYRASNDLFDPIEGFCETAVEPAVISGLPFLTGHLSESHVRGSVRSILR